MRPRGPGRVILVRSNRDLLVALAMTSPGATIELAAGRYELPSPLSLGGTLQLRGAGTDETVIVGRSGNCILNLWEQADVVMSRMTLEWLGPEAADLVTSAGASLEIRDCRLVGARANGAGGVGVRLIGSGRTRIEQCLFERNAWAGVGVYGRSHGTITHCRFVRDGSAVVAADEAEAHVDENDCDECADEAIVFMGRSTGRAVQNRCRGPNRHGIAVTDAADADIERNTVEGARKQGILFWAQARGSARDNVVERSRLHGICVGGSAEVTVAKNRALRSGQHGILVTGEAEAQVLENECDDNARAGINVWSRARATLRGNHCRRNGRGLWLGEEAEVAVEGNVVEESREHGVVFEGAVSGTARGNRSAGAGLDGIHVEGSGALLLEGNACRDNGRAGILIEPGAAAELRDNDEDRCVRGERELLGELVVPSGSLAIAGPGGGTVALAGFPGDRPIRVEATRMATEPFASAVRWLVLEIAADATVARREDVGAVVLGDCLLLGEAAALEAAREDDLAAHCRAAPGGAASIDVGGRCVLGLTSGWGTGTYAVLREIDRDGNLVRALLHLGSPAAVHARKLHEGMPVADDEPPWDDETAAGQGPPSSID